MKNKKVKLSSTQVGVIERLKKGEKLHRIQGLYPRCFFDKDKGNISWATINKLESLGIIQRNESGVILVLTELGKTYESPFKEDTV